MRIRLFFSLVLCIIVFQFGVLSSKASLPYVEAVDWNSDGRYLLRAFNTEVIEVLDVSNDVVILHLELNGIFRAMAWNPIEPTIFVIAQDSFATRRPMISVYDAVSGEVLFIENYENSAMMTSTYISAITWNPEGTLLAVGTDFATPSNLNRDVEIIDISNGRLVASILLGAFGSTHLAWSPDGERLATTTTDGAISVWRALSAERIITMTQYRSQMTSWSPDGAWMVGIDTQANSVLQIWNTATGELSALVPDIHAITLDWHPESRHFVTTDNANLLAIWHVQSGTLFRVIEFESEIYDVAWSPDGEQLALGTIGGTAIIEVENI